MTRKPVVLAIGAIALSTICSLMAQTSEWKAGDTLTYELVTHTQISGGHLPSQAYAAQAPQNSAIKMSVTGLDPSGTALVHVVIDRPFPEKDMAAKMSGGPLAGPRNSVIMASARKEWVEQNHYKEFDARFNRDGALLVAVDDSPQSDNSPKPNGLSQADLAHYRDAIVADVHSPAYQAKLAENEVAGTFTIPNVIALSCAKRTSFEAGDAWRVVSKTDNATYDVNVTGKEAYRGHDAVVLSAKSRFDNPNGSNLTEASVYYDPQSHLVLGMHSVLTSNIQVTGMTSVTTSDFNLKP